MHKTPKSQIKKSGESFIKAKENLVETAYGAKDLFCNTSKGIYHAIDAGDLSLANKLDQKYGKARNKIADFTRKNIIKILLAISILTYGGSKVLDWQKDANKKTPDSAEVIPESYLQTIDYKIPTPEGLKGRKVADLYSHYLGYGGSSVTIGDTIEFRPNIILDNLYTIKFNRKNKKGFTVAKTFYENSVKNHNFDIVVPSDLKSLRKNINFAINEVNQFFDRKGFLNQKLSEYRKNNKKKKEEEILKGEILIEKKTELFRKLCERIDDRCLLSYGMTELMPSADGKLNQEVLDFLLKTGGEEFVLNLPAIADDYTSFGLYQFTSFAVFDTGTKKEGASVMNTYLSETHQIPGSVSMLKGSDHHKAAYLFAMYNLYTLVFNAQEEELNALNYLLNQEDNRDLAQLIAIMHNLPASGKVFLKERYKLNTDSKYLYKKTHNKSGKETYHYDLNTNGKIDLYESLLNPASSHNYGKKTFFNHKALK